MKFWQLWILLFIVTSNLFAEYAWIPKPQTLYLRAGWDYTSSSDNYNSDSLLEDVIVVQQSYFASFTENLFWIEPEYGVAPGLAAKLRIEVVSASSDPIGLVGNSFGVTSLKDISLGLKWQAMKKKFPLTFEGLITFPTYSIPTSAVTELSPGDGSADVLLKVHGGYRFGLGVVTASTGILARFNGYAPQWVLALAIGARYTKVYGFLTLDSGFSMQESHIPNSTLTQHLALGAAGSYARLSSSPSHVDLGIKLGVKISKTYGIEAKFDRSIWGIRYPSYFRFGLNLLLVHNFFNPPQRTRLKEVPFNEEDL